jgi:DNA polymerase III subunit chi
MTEISFYFSAPNRAGYACRLVRQAQRQGMALTVTGPAAALAAFDHELWSFAGAEFVAHSPIERLAEVPAALHATTVWLSADPLAAPCHQALVNLGDELPAGFETFARLFEIVSHDEADRQSARARWKTYQHRGYPIKRHEVTA